MTVDEILTKVREMAGQDEELLHRILQTASGEHPVDSFCSLCRDLGFTLYAMDLAARILRCLRERTTIMRCSWQS